MSRRKISLSQVQINPEVYRGWDAYRAELGRQGLCGIPALEELHAELLESGQLRLWWPLGKVDAMVLVMPWNWKWKLGPEPSRN